MAVFKEAVFDVLEGILALQGHIPEGKIPGAEHKVFPCYATGIHGDAPSEPAELRGFHIAVFHGDIAAFPQRLDAVKLTAPDGHILGVPQGRPAQGGQLAVFNCQADVVPEGVAQVEKAVGHLNVPAFLEGAFPVRRTVEFTVFHQKILLPIQGPLLVEGLILKDFHIDTSFSKKDYRNYNTSIPPRQ